jgi:predicted HTH transcriptional regulator
LGEGLNLRKRVYSLREIMKELLVNGSRNLVTRETGKRMREALEERLQAESPGEVIILDFKGVGILDYSCADEIVAKLISRLNGNEYGDRYLLLRGLNPTQKENLEVALERKHLAALFLNEEKKWEVLGVLNNYLKETLSEVMAKGRITARDLADAEDLEINTSSTRLANLHKIQLVQRREEVLSEGGRQFVYESLLV